MPALYSKLNLWYKKKRNTILSLFLYLKKMNIIFVSILFLLYQFNNSVQSGCITMTTPCVKCSSNVEIVTTTLVEKELKTRNRATVFTLPPASTFLFNVFNVRPSVHTQKAKPVSLTIR